MATKASIIAAITTKIGSTKCDIWRIGLTNDLAERKKYWGETERKSVAYWSAWEADSLSDAQDIERSFISKGMDGGTGGNLDSRYKTYIYVF
jgi:hypothetical protein